MHHGDPAHIDLAGIAADQDDFRGDRHGTDQCDDLAGTELQRAAFRASQQHQTDKGQANPQALHQAWAPAQYQPLQQRHKGYVQGSDKGRLAAADGL
ncbi:hypothetical protein D3C79_757540 [compost metagenome]